MAFVEYVAEVAQKCGWSEYEFDSSTSVTINISVEEAEKVVPVEVFMHGEQGSDETFITFRTGYPVNLGGWANLTNLLMRELMIRNRELFFTRWELHGEQEDNMLLMVRQTLPANEVTLGTFKKTVEDVVLESLEFMNFVIKAGAEAELQ